MIVGYPPLIPIVRFEESTESAKWLVHINPVVPRCSRNNHPHLIGVAGDFRLGLFQVCLYSRDIMTCQGQTDRLKALENWKIFPAFKNQELPNFPMILMKKNKKNHWRLMFVPIMFSAADGPLQTTEFQPWISWRVGGETNPILPKQKCTKTCHSLL